MSGLVLTRKPVAGKDTIFIHTKAEGIIAKIQVTEVSRGQVKFVLEADDEILIDREEIYAKKALASN